MHAMSSKNWKQFKSLRLVLIDKTMVNRGISGILHLFFYAGK